MKKINCIISILVLSAVASLAQPTCFSNVNAELDESGEVGVPISDFVPNLEFLLTQGTVTYYIFPGTSEEVTSVDQIVNLNCQNLGAGIFLIELTEGGAIIGTCWGNLNLTSPNGGCPNYSQCQDPALDCSSANSYFTPYLLMTDEVDAIEFASCDDDLNCPGEYQVAIGYVANSNNLDFSSTIIGADVTDYITPIVLSYSINGVVDYSQTNLYVWDNLECVVVTNQNTSVPLNEDGEATLIPDLFLAESNSCDNLSIAIGEVNGDVPDDFASEVVVNCDYLGFLVAYIKDENDGMITSAPLFLSDPLETCGPVLGPGDRLIKIINTPPMGTYFETSVEINGYTLPTSPSGDGWIINEEVLIDGLNTINFDSGPCDLNGVSTLDMVLGLRIIINDEYDPMQALAFDLDQSGYVGIGDLLMIRELILAISDGEGIPNLLFRPSWLFFNSDFDPFAFDLDLTKYEFDSADFETEDFMFEVYKMGDLNNTAVAEDTLKSDVVIETRSIDAYEVSEMNVIEGETFTFTLSYDSGVNFKGLLAALVSDGVEFTGLTSSFPESVVQFNIIENTEIRISYISLNPDETINEISFDITAKATKTGKLIDLLGLKQGFPQEVIDENNVVIPIKNLEEDVVSSLNEIGLPNDVSVYPNPVGETLFIESQESDILQIRVFDVLGKITCTKSINARLYLLDVSKYESGVYMIHIESDGGIEKQVFIKN